MMFIEKSTRILEPGNFKECGSHQSSRLLGEALHLGEYIFLHLRQFSGTCDSLSATCDNLPATRDLRPATRDPRPATRDPRQFTRKPRVVGRLDSHVKMTFELVDVRYSLPEG